MSRRNIGMIVGLLVLSVALLVVFWPRDTHGEADLRRYEKTSGVDFVPNNKPEYFKVRSCPDQPWSSLDDKRIQDKWRTVEDELTTQSLAQDLWLQPVDLNKHTEVVVVLGDGVTPTAAMSVADMLSGIVARKQPCA